MCEKTLFDYIATCLPILLSALLVAENVVFHYRDKKLQQEIHNRDIRLRKHDDILAIYSVYYEVIDLLYTNNIAVEVKLGNIYYVMNCRFSLSALRSNIIKKLDLASLLLKRSDNELYKNVEARFKLAIEIIDKYLYYINGNFTNTSVQAWRQICEIYKSLQQYNYAQLYQNQEAVETFLKLCETSETKEIDNLLEKYKQLHSYDKFDIYFEKYIGMEELK